MTAERSTPPAFGLVDENLPLLPPQRLALTKRAAMLLADMLAKPHGITSIDYPGVRVADGIFKLRKAGVAVETVHEVHGGEFAGHHARYVLKSVVRAAI